MIRVKQNEIGRFYTLNSDLQLVFSIGVYEDDEIIKTNGYKCILHIEAEGEDILSLRDTLEEKLVNGDIDYLVERAFKYLDEVISSRDYESELLAFIKGYYGNYYEIQENLLNEKKEEIRRQIEELKRQLEYFEVNDSRSGTIYVLQKRLGRINERINSLRNGKEDYVKGSQPFIETGNRIQKLANRKSVYEKIIRLIKESEVEA